MSCYIDRLISQASTFWSAGEPIPLDLAVTMMEAGLDVETLERKHRAS